LALNPATLGLRETVDPYNTHFYAEKSDIDEDNIWFWDLNH